MARWWQLTGPTGNAARRADRGAAVTRNVAAMATFTGRGADRGRAAGGHRRRSGTATAPGSSATARSRRRSPGSDRSARPTSSASVTRRRPRALILAVSVADLDDKEALLQRPGPGVLHHLPFRRVRGRARRDEDGADRRPARGARRRVALRRTTGARRRVPRTSTVAFAAPAVSLLPVDGRGRARAVRRPRSAGAGAGAALAALLAGITAQEWSLPTECPAWTSARDRPAHPRRRPVAPGAPTRRGGAEPSHRDSRFPAGTTRRPPCSTASTSAGCTRRPSSPPRS